MRDVFEDDRVYTQVFSQARLGASSEQIVLCYKAQFRVRKLISEIVDKGPNKYAYVVAKARYLLWALLCQGILNDSDLPKYSESFGQGLGVEADYTEWLSQLATTRCRFLIADLVEDKAYKEKAAEGNFSFLRTNRAYERCMEFAHKRYKWTQKRLR
jgi:hypothetical protein